MASVGVPTEWLINAWGGGVKQDMNPIMCIDGESLKVTIFPKGAAGMRVITRRIPTSGHVTFKITDAMRAYVKLLSNFPDITLNIHDTNLSIVAQDCCAAIQYNFPNITVADDNVIPVHPQDIRVVIPTTQWLNVWRTIPPKGTINIVVSKTARSITLKHDRGRWAGALQARDKPTCSRSFKCDAHVAKKTFAFVEPTNTFSHLFFMDCGVLKWSDGDNTIYLAPFE